MCELATFKTIDKLKNVYECGYFKAPDAAPIEFSTEVGGVQPTLLVQTFVGETLN